MLHPAVERSSRQAKKTQRTNKGVGNADAPVPDNELQLVAGVKAELELDLSQGVGVGVDNGVGHGLADGGFHIPQLVQGGVQLGGEGGGSRPGKGLVGRPGKKIRQWQKHCIYCI